MGAQIGIEYSLGSERNPSELYGIGIALKEISEGQLHIGILYRANDVPPTMCHLACHLDLKNEPARDDYFWADCEWLVNDYVNSKVIAAFLQKIAVHKSIISYGIHHEGHPFEPDGSFVGFPDDGMGLTCATFVIAVFHSIGFGIAVSETWQSRDDDAEWQAMIVEGLKKIHGPSQHINAVEEHIGVARFRPEEVAAAATSADPPLEFEDAVKLAAQIKSTVSAATLLPGDRDSAW